MSRRSAAAFDRKVDPYHIYVAACDYHKASGRLYRIYQEEVEKAKTGGLVDARLLYPQMTLSALASELYFKSIYGLQTDGQSSDRHDLSWFYKQIEQTRKAIIQRHWDTELSNDQVLSGLKQNLPGIKLDIGTCLKRSRDAFVNLRYRFEDRPQDFLIGNLPRVLRLSIHEMQPQWESAGGTERSVIAALPRKADGSLVEASEVGDIPVQDINKPPK